MNPEIIAKFDQAGAGMREVSGILAQMAKPLIELGVSPEAAASLSLELTQTMLAASTPVRNSDSDDG